MREDGSNQIFARRLQREWLKKIGSGDERREYRSLDVPGGFLRIIFYGLLGQDRLLQCGEEGDQGWDGIVSINIEICLSNGRRPWRGRRESLVQQISEVIYRLVPDLLILFRMEGGGIKSEPGGESPRVIVSGLGGEKGSLGGSGRGEDCWEGD